MKVFEQLTEVGEDRAKARVIAEASEHLEERHRQLKEVATQGQVRETELRLQKEIKEVEAKLARDIEGVRLEIKEVEARPARDIEQSRRETREAEIRLVRAIHRQTLWVVGSVGAVVGSIRLLEWALARL